MKKKIEQILVEHFKEHFGKLIAEMLLKQKFKQHNIENIETLSLKDKIKFGEDVIDEIFNQFYDKDKIMNMHILYQLRFSINEAIEKIERMINKDAEIELGQLDNFDLNLIDNMMVDLDNEERVNFGFEVSNITEGVMLFSIDKEQVVTFGAMMIEIMQGEKPKDYELDEMKVSAIYEFFNILLPSFAEVIGNIYDMQAYYVPIRYNQFKEKYFVDGQLFTPKQILKTFLNINIKNIAMKGDIYFIIGDAGEIFSDLVEKSSKEADDPWEQDPPRILVEKSDDKKKDLTTFFKLLHLKVEDMDNIMELINKKDNFRFDATDVIALNKKLIEKHFHMASRNKMNTIKANLLHIFNIKP